MGHRKKILFSTDVSIQQGFYYLTIPCELKRGVSPHFFYLTNGAEIADAAVFVAHFLGSAQSDVTQREVAEARSNHRESLEKSQRSECAQQNLNRCVPWLTAGPRLPFADRFISCAGAALKDLVNFSKRRRNNCHSLGRISGQAVHL